MKLTNKEILAVKMLLQQRWPSIDFNDPIHLCPTYGHVNFGGCGTSIRPNCKVCDYEQILKDEMIADENKEET